MDPKVWGPSAWSMLHFFASHSIQTEQKQALCKIIQSLPRVLPCAKCRYNFKDHIRSLPPPCNTDNIGKRSLLMWTFRLHNRVNKSLGKPEMSSDILAKYKGNFTWRDIGPFVSSIVHAHPGKKFLDQYSDVRDAYVNFFQSLSIFLDCHTYPREDVIMNKRRLQCWFSHIYKNNDTLVPKCSEQACHL